MNSKNIFAWILEFEFILNAIYSLYVENVEKIT